MENEANEESYEVNVRDLKFGTINFLLRQTGSDRCNSIRKSRGMLFENRSVVILKKNETFFFFLPFLLHFINISYFKDETVKVKRN